MLNPKFYVNDCIDNYDKYYSSYFCHLRNPCCTHPSHHLSSPAKSSTLAPINVQILTASSADKFLFLFLSFRLAYKALYGMPVALDIADKLIAFLSIKFAKFFVTTTFSSPLFFVLKTIYGLYSLF